MSRLSTQFATKLQEPHFNSVTVSGGDDAGSTGFGGEASLEELALVKVAEVCCKGIMIDVDGSNAFNFRVEKLRKCEFQSNKFKKVAFLPRKYINDVYISIIGVKRLFTIAIFDNLCRINFIQRKSFGWTGIGNDIRH